MEVSIEDNVLLGINSMLSLYGTILNSSAPKEYVAEFNQKELVNIPTLNEVLVIAYSPNKYGVQITKSIILYQKQYKVTHSDVLEIMDFEDRETATNELLDKIKIRFDTPFLLYYSAYSDDTEFYNQYLLFYIGEYIPFPEWNKPLLKNHISKIDFGWAYNDFIVTQGLSNYFDKTFSSSLSSLLDVNYGNTEFQEYVKNQFDDHKKFADVSLQKYNETGNEIFYLNYIVTKFKLGEIVDDEFYTMLEQLKEYTDTGKLPGDFDYKIELPHVKGESPAKSDLHLFLIKAYLYQLLSEYKRDIIEEVYHVFDYLNKHYNYKELELNFIFDLIANGPGAPNHNTYIPKDFSKKYPLRREIYNNLTLLKHIHGLDDKIFNNAKSSIDALTKPDNLDNNISILKDDELFNLGLYFFVFQKFELAYDVFNKLLEKGYEPQKSENMLAKIDIMMRHKESKFKNNMPFFVTKKNKVETELDIYRIAYNQSCQCNEVDTIKSSIIANYQLLDKNKKEG